MNLKDTYDTIAVDWHKDHLTDDWWINGMEKFAALLSVGAVVLDAGCAGGVKSKFLAERGFRVTGIDFAPNFIEIAKREVPEAEFHVLDIRDIASMEKEFDGVVMQAVLLHFPKKEITGILRNTITKIKPNGILFLSVKEPREGQSEEEVEIENDYGYEYERFFSYFSKQELEDVLRKLGLDIELSDVHLAGKTRWLQIIARKK
ncbi:MAG: class I SAM-dependent methyltransferase [Candidatus Moranbacteria bacterium]|nr:class I SAM-dependent methyltransferase [Candidatus Moranbacteria bacterium]MDD3965010.1 class I SAM-dependent methyltransferase [Candidatus Moranbacteria bacterium]